MDEHNHRFFVAVMVRLNHRFYGYSSTKNHLSSRLTGGCGAMCGSSIGIVSQMCNTSTGLTGWSRCCVWLVVWLFSWPFILPYRVPVARVISYLSHQLDRPGRLAQTSAMRGPSRPGPLRLPPPGPCACGPVSAYFPGPAASREALSRLSMHQLIVSTAEYTCALAGRDGPRSL